MHGAPAVLLLLDGFPEPRVGERVCSLKSSESVCTFGRGIASQEEGDFISCLFKERWQHVLRRYVVVKAKR